MQDCHAATSRSAPDVEISLGFLCFICSLVCCPIRSYNRPRQFPISTCIPRTVLMGMFALKKNLLALLGYR